MGRRDTGGVDGGVDGVRFKDCTMVTRSTLIDMEEKMSKVMAVNRQEKLILGTSYIIEGLRILQKAITGDYQHEEPTVLVQVLSQMELVLFNMKKHWGDWEEFVQSKERRERCGK